MIGSSLGHYEILESLGAGGMGEVFRARDTTLGRDVAIKVLPEDLASDPERLRRFEGEAKVVAALDHPNIVTIHTVEQAPLEGRDAPVHFITMQLVEGQTLSEVIPDGGLPLKQFFELAIQLVDAVHAAHRKGITHRDLKPANVMVDGQGRLKVLDFGLAKLQEDPTDAALTEMATQHLTEEGQIMGTVAYMSPEQAEGKPIDNRSDLFSLGILLYEMATGVRPFQGDTKVSLMAAIVKDTPNSIADQNQTLPRHLGRIINRALQKDVTRRHQSALDLRNELEQLRDELASGESTPLLTSAPSEPAAPPAAKWRRYAYAAVALLVVVGLAAVAFFQRGEVPDAAPGSVAVVYFENLTDPADSEQLGRMMVTLLTNELARSPDLAVTSSQRIYDIAHQLGGDDTTVDRSTATAIAERAGVAAMLTGQISQVGNRLLVTTELIEVSSGTLLASQQAEGESIDDIFAMAATLGGEVRSGLRQPGAAEPGPDDLDGQLTDSVEALQAYLRGMVLGQRIDIPGAVEQFREAVRLDPEFAVAQFRLSLFASWAGNQDEARQAAAQAVRSRDRAPAQYRDLISASQLYIDGRYTEALPVLDRIVAAQPENVDALYLLSEMAGHSVRHVNLETAAALLERVLALDPPFSVIYWELPFVYAHMGQYEEARRVLDRMELEQPAAVEEVRAYVLALEGDPEEALRSSPVAASFVSQPLRVLYASLASQWEVALDLARGEGGIGWVRAWVARQRGDVLAYRGEFDVATEAYHEMEREEFDAPDGWIAAIPLTRYHAMAELHSLRDDPEGALAAIQQALEIQPEALRTLYLAGLYALRSGRAEEAAGYRERLAALIATSRTSSGWVYRDGLDAEIALTGGDAETARDLLEDIVRSGHLLAEWWIYGGSSGALFRDALARAYLALDRPDEEVTALQGLIASGYERIASPVLYVRALYRLGVLSLELGREAEGRAYLEQFLDHWGDADWDLPEVADARARLEQ